MQTVITANPDMRFEMYFRDASAAGRSRIVNLPELKGSDEQIAQAQDIREKFIREFVGQVLVQHDPSINSRYGKRVYEPPFVERDIGHPELNAYMARLNQALQSKDGVFLAVFCNDSAEYWISNRNETVNYLAHKIAILQGHTAPLPDLTGSPKQIAWATSIRAKACAALGATDLTEIERQALAAYYDATTDARYWIDRRRIKDDGYLWRQELQKWAGEAGLMPKQEWRKII